MQTEILLCDCGHYDIDHKERKYKCNACSCDKVTWDYENEDY